MRDLSLVLAIILILLPFVVGAAVAEIKVNQSKVNETQQGAPLKNIKILYELKKNESLSDKAVKRLNDKLRSQGADELLKGFKEFNFTFEATRNGSRYFVVSSNIRNGSIHEVYFGEYPKAGKNVNNLYLRLDMDFMKGLTEKWENATNGGEKKPGLGLMVSIGYRLSKGLIQGKIQVKPFWAVLEMGKFLRVSSALREPTGAILLG